MEKNKIALRYCGGCNPRYDRINFVRRLQRQFPDLQMEVFEPRGEYQAVLVICGCSAQCAGQGDLPVHLPRFVMAVPGDYDRAAAFFNGVYQNLGITV